MTDAPHVPAEARGARFAPEIEMLRGLAALGVLVFHARVALWVGWREIQARPADFSAWDHALAWLSAPTPFLGAGVMLFFVISGFCVHQPIAGARVPPRWGAFWWRRFARVYPPYLAAVATSVGVAVWLGLDVHHVLSSAFMAQNYTGAATETSLASQVGTNPSLWSLPVEMEFYLLYPLLWRSIARVGWRWTLGAVASVTALAAAACLAGARVLDGNFALYWLVWCGGAWLREQQAAGSLRRPGAGWSAVAGTALALGIALTWRHEAPLAHLCWGAASFWLVWRCVAVPPIGAEQVLARALRATGRWSYSLYLLHFPLLLLAGAGWTQMFGGKPASFAVTLAGCAAVFAPVVVFHRLVEQPSHAWARRVGA
ncbi:MAG: acyltransferase [Candidatus Didemnitutus sp.]|nr:acyltransferase [Candidatus Didemnitutus sp.]